MLEALPNIQVLQEYRDCHSVGNVTCPVVIEQRTGHRLPLTAPRRYRGPQVWFYVRQPRTLQPRISLEEKSFTVAQRHPNGHIEEHHSRGVHARLKGQPMTEPGRRDEATVSEPVERCLAISSP
jgi:hypothetical protein